jgi:hypothetical protein
VSIHLVKPICWDIFLMAKAHEQDGFRFYIRNPPREHGPPHVHVQKAGGEVAINLTPADGEPLIREVYGMKAADVARAVRLVDANIDVLMDVWRRLHGDAP